MFGTDTWDNYDNGQYTNETLTEEFLSKAKTQSQKDTIMKVMHLWHTEKYLPTNKTMIDFIINLRQNGYHTYILSNAPYDVPVEIEARGIGKLFDGKVFSCNLHINKPDSRIYENIISTYNLNPEECIFLDDKVDNIEAAKKFGIHGIVYNKSLHNEVISSLKEDYNLNL